MGWTYVKGHWQRAEEATVSIAERGFRYGDGVFETLRVMHGTPLFLKDHLERLEAGLRALRIPNPQENLGALCRELLETNNAGDGVLRLSVSRGIGGRGYLPQAPQPPTVVIELLPLPSPPEKPLTLWLSAIRKPGPESLPVEHKLMQGLNSTLARMEAAEHGCDEALMLNMHGHLTEASGANLFWRDKEGIVHTPALSCGLLAGIGRKVLLRDWPEPVREGCYPPSVLEEALSVMLVNSVTGPVAAGSLRPQGLHWDGSLAKQAQEIWQKAILQQLN